MNTLTFTLKTIAHIVYGGISGFVTPLLLLVSFNFMHGVANNPDGEALVPFGVFGLLVIALVDIWIVLRTVLSQSKTRTQKWLMLSLFVLAKLVGLSMVEQNGLLNFIEYFKCVCVR